MVEADRISCTFIPHPFRSKGTIMSNFDSMTPSEQDAWHEGRRKGFRAGAWSCVTLVVPLFAVCLALLAFAVVTHDGLRAGDDYSSMQEQEAAAPGQPYVNWIPPIQVHDGLEFNPPTHKQEQYCKKQFKKHPAMRRCAFKSYYLLRPSAQPTYPVDPDNPPPPRAGGYDGGSTKQPAPMTPPTQFPDVSNDVNTGDPGGF
jgi:hypothetical protein